MVGNTGSNSTREALHATEQGFAVGMDAALQINPYYGKTSMTGLREHFKWASPHGGHGGAGQGVRHLTCSGAEQRLPCTEQHVCAGAAGRCWLRALLSSTTCQAAQVGCQERASAGQAATRCVANLGA